MAGAATFVKNGKKRKVLIVDDEQINRRLLGKIIEEEYEALYAENGEEALEIIRQNSETLSIVLLDLLMPKMDGYELLGILREDKMLSRIPVIVLTAERTAEVRSLRLGAAEFIPKPYAMTEVILASVSRSIALAVGNSIISATENDPLTGLYSKEFFFEHCKRYENYYPNAEMDMLVLNINRFHLINELRGRLFGDNVLRTAAEQLTRILDDSEGIACRCDADTFYVYTARTDSYDAFLDRIVFGLSSIAGGSRISIRMGVYRSDDRSLAIEARFDRANFACNSRRGNYHNGIAFYDSIMHQREVYSEKLIGSMDDGVAGRQFKVYYQPKYNIVGDEPVLVSAEALIRWDHPEYGLVPPGSFVPLFEENGLVQKLDFYVWREAAAQIRNWKDKFGIAIPVSVNVSRTDISDPEFEDVLFGIIKEYGLEPGEFLLEITESAYTDDSEQIIETVKKLRKDGFKIEMDDFGAGYSSLNMLAPLPIDALKLDMLFIRKITNEEKDKKMVELMIDIAKFLGIPVIAEGVETQEQYDLLKKLGCDIIQGYYFSKPVPPEDFERFIESKIG